MADYLFWMGLVFGPIWLISKLIENCARSINKKIDESTTKIIEENRRQNAEMYSFYRRIEKEFREKYKF